MAGARAMSTNTPKFRIGLASLRYPVLGLLIGFLAYQSGAVTLVSVLLAISLPLILVVGVIQSRIVLFKKHLSRFGAPINLDEIEHKYSTHVLGTVPFNNAAVTCNVYANENGVAIGRKGSYRELPWSDIVFLKHRLYFGHPIAELSISNVQDKRIVIPWSETISDYLPSSMCQ